MELDNRSVCARIQFLMDSLAVTQNRFAQMLGVTQPAVSKYLQNRIPPPGVLLKLARITGTSMEWILTGEKKDFPGKKVSEPRAVFGRTDLWHEVEKLPLKIRGPLINLIAAITKEEISG